MGRQWNVITAMGWQLFLECRFMVAVRSTTFWWLVGNRSATKNCTHLVMKRRELSCFVCHEADIKTNSMAYYIKVIHGMLGGNAAVYHSALGMKRIYVGRLMLNSDAIKTYLVFHNRVPVKPILHPDILLKSKNTSLNDTKRRLSCYVYLPPYKWYRIMTY